MTDKNSAEDALSEQLCNEMLALEPVGYMPPRVDGQKASQAKPGEKVGSKVVPRVEPPYGTLEPVGYRPPRVDGEWVYKYPAPIRCHRCRALLRDGHSDGCGVM